MFVTCAAIFIDVMLGEAMREKDISIAHVYASPSLRCVESACSLLHGNLL